MISVGLSNDLSSLRDKNAYQLFPGNYHAHEKLHGINHHKNYLGFHCFKTSLVQHHHILIPPSRTILERKQNFNQ